MKKYQKFYFILGKEAVHETRAGGFLNVLKGEDQ